MEKRITGRLGIDGEFRLNDAQWKQLQADMIAASSSPRIGH
jgi:hypothetical protein